MSASSEYYIGLYMAGKLAYMLKRTTNMNVEETDLRFYQFLLAMPSILLAIWIGVSRIRDYRHDNADVLAGHLIKVLSNKPLPASLNATNRFEPSIAKDLMGQSNTSSRHLILILPALITATSKVKHRLMLCNKPVILMLLNLLIYQMT